MEVGEHGVQHWLVAPARPSISAPISACRFITTRSSGENAPGFLSTLSGMPIRMVFLTLGHPALAALARQLEEAGRAGHWAQACAQWQTLRGGMAELGVGLAA